MSSTARFCKAALVICSSGFCMRAVFAEDKLNGKVLTVAAENYPPWFKIHEGNLVTIAYSGVSYKILQFLETTLNFTSEIVRPPDGSWGSINESGHWGGMVGMVKRREVDFGLGPFSVNSPRAHVIDYTITVYVEEQTALLSFKPSRGEGVLIKVFDWRIWIMLLILSPTYILVSGYSERFFTGHVNWWRQVDFTLRTICMDSVYPCIPQTRNYNKILSLTWIWGCFIMFAAYSGNLKSILMKPWLPDIIDTVDELVQQDKIKWFFPNKGSYEMRGKNAAEGSTLKLIFQRGIPIRGSCEKTVEMIRTGHFSHICDKLVAQTVISSEFSSSGICSYYTTRPLGHLPFAMIFQKGSPYVNLVNEKLQLLQQLGLIETWIKDAVANASNCNTLSKIVSSHKRDREASLTWDQMNSISCFLIFGLLMSVAGFAAEAVKGKCRGRGDGKIHETTDRFDCLEGPNTSMEQKNVACVLGDHL